MFINQMTESILYENGLILDKSWWNTFCKSVKHDQLKKQRRQVVTNAHLRISKLWSFHCLYKLCYSCMWQYFRSICVRWNSVQMVTLYAHFKLRKGQSCFSSVLFIIAVCLRKQRNPTLFLYRLFRATYYS